MQWRHVTWFVKLQCFTAHLNETDQLSTCIHICSQQRSLLSIIHTQVVSDMFSTSCNKKHRYREEHSASVMLTRCTLWHLSGDNEQINS